MQQYSIEKVENGFIIREPYPLPDLNYPNNICLKSQPMYVFGKLEDALAHLKKRLSDK